jgi:hypothetical protein
VSDRAGTQSPDDHDISTPPAAEDYGPMRTQIRWSGLLALALVLPALGDDKTGPNKPGDKDARKYDRVGQLFCKVLGVNPATSEMTVEYQVGLGRYARMDKKELTLANEVTVWYKNPPEKPDEDGKMKKLSPAELDKLKSKYGPTRGLYAGEATDLRRGQQIELVLGRPKDAPKKPASKDKAAAKESEFIYVTQVVIVTDAPPPKPEKKK